MALFVYVPAMLEPGDEVAAVAQCSTMKSPLQKVSGLARLPSALKDGKAHCTSVLPLCTTKPADRFAAHAQASFGLKLCAVTVGSSDPAFSGRWLWREKTMISTPMRQEFRRIRKAPRIGALLLLLIVWALGGLPRRTAYAQPPKTILISDIDDTIKLTRLIHRGNYGDALENIFNAHGAFVGMADIYSRLHENGVEIIYVSGAIRLISRLPNDFIEDSKFPSGQVFLRVSPFTSIEDFKVKTIQGILQQNRGARVVLIGENGERDCASYERIREDPQVGSMVQRIYIHKLYEGPPSMVPPVDQLIFITAGELAVGLHTDGLLTVDQLRDVLVTVGDGLDSHDPKTRNRTLPAFAEISKGDVERAFGHSESPQDDISEQVAKIRLRVLAQVKP